VLFTRFELDNHDPSSGMKVAANLEFSKDNKMVKLKPVVQFAAGKKESFPIFLPQERPYAKDSVVVTLEGINADSKSILLKMSGSGSNNQQKGSLTDSIVIEISHKPLMSILWLGTILMIFGSLVALYKRIHMTGRL
jgi:cytochrome c-type biogenesis protein CcmF